MASYSEDITAIFYVSFEVKRNDFGAVTGISAKGVTQGRPTAPQDYTLQFRVSVPKSSLSPDVVDVKIESPDTAIAALQQTAKDLSPK